MAKPWSRYQVGFINHPKFLVLSGNAILLWLEGKNYADEHLTDGYLPLAVVKGFRFYSPKAMQQLRQSAGPKNAAAEEHYAPLWEPHALGVKMHDFLEHNEPADAHRARMQQAEKSKDGHRERMREWRERRRTNRRGDAPVTPSVTVDVTPPVTGGVTSQPPVVTLLTEEELKDPPNPPEGLLMEAAIGDRACAFFERYPQVYAKARNGAHYRPKEARDFPTVLDLVHAYPDVDRLCLMAEVFLKRTDIGPKNVPGTIGQFAHMAPDCDAKLREHGR